MRHLIISEIALLSEVEKRARRETLDPKRTIVLGSNETGKSSLLKAIYHTFGAEPAKQHPRWQNAEVKSLVKFSVDTERYILLRDSSYFALFSGDGGFLKSFTRISGGLGPYLSQILGFGLVLASRQEELSSDFKFLKETVTDEIECPTCGNHYENDFAVRFSIASDEDRVTEFVAHINAEITRLEGEISNVYENYSVAKGEAERIQSILSEKQGELTLGTVIESEGRRAADKLLNDQLDSIKGQTEELNIELGKIKDELRALNAKSSGVRKQVMEEYERSLRENFISLDVLSFSEVVFKSLTPHLIEIGSTLPRALLAYQFTILDLISKRSPATVCPIVIDSPNQQAQDKDSLTRILKFISEHQPHGTQLILGLENDMGLTLGGKLISTPSYKYRLLEDDQYQSVHDEIFGLLKNSLRNSD